ncbi:MAG: hypothetical protein ABI644_15145 [Arenimonas sp.]
MLEYSHPIFIKGRYRVVALTENQEFNEDQIMAYAVLNSSGAKIRHELSLVDAKEWMEKLVEEDAPDVSVATPQIKPRRVRR